jgi:hypothetical protein
MKLRLGLLVTVAAVVAIPASPAAAGNGDKVSGGGTVWFSDDDVKRSTIAFTAQGTTSAAKGQVQFIDRSAGAGRNQVKYHGIVDCLEVTGNYAVAGGYRKGTSPSTDRFVLRVVDNGEPNRGIDMIEFDDETEDNACGDDEEDSDPEFALATGNAQVRDGDSSNPQTQSSTMSFTSALKLAGLRR